MNGGFIKLYRQFLDWEWYDDINVKVLFIHLLLKANHKNNKRRGKLVKRGQLITGLHSLTEQTGLTIQKIRTALEKLEKTGEVTIKSTSKYSLITVVNYNKYQERGNKNNKQVTNKQQTNNKQITTNKNDKNNKNIYIGIFQKWNSKKITEHKKLNDDLKNQMRIALKKYSLQEIKKAIENYGNVFNSQKTYFTHKRTLLEFLKRKNGLPVFLHKSVGDYLKEGSTETSITDGKRPAVDKVYNEQEKRMQDKLKLRKPPTGYKSVTHINNWIEAIKEGKD